MAEIPNHHELLQRIQLLQGFRKLDETRHKEIDHLAHTCLQLTADLHTVRSDLEDEQNMRRGWKKRAEEAEAAIQRKFVAVLVDGDGYIFRKAFFHLPATSGGSKAANELYNEVVNNLRAADALPDIDIKPDCDVLVNIYANKAGLARILATADYLNHPSQIDHFFSSFSQSRSLFQFIDCGQGKERVDAKLRDTFRFYAYNAQCQRVFLACCHDNGYIAEFDKYRHDPIVMPKVVLVHAAQTTASARAYAGLPFQSTRFDAVFEASPLDLMPKMESPYIPLAVDELSLASSPTEHPRNDLNPTASRSSISSNSAASGLPPLVTLPLNNTKATFKGNLPPPLTEVAKPKASNQSYSSTANGTSDSKAGIPINRCGQRIDLKMRIPTAAEMDRFESRIAQRKLCNEHHLRDNCESYNCRYDHEPIDDSMKNTLKYKARSIACAQGAKCRRLDCFYGHQCPWGNNNCAHPKCTFIRAGLHDIKDLEIARFVPAQPGA